MEPSNINLIFESWGSTSVLAHAEPYCVTGITLPPVDATRFAFLSLSVLAVGEGTKKEVYAQLCVGGGFIAVIVSRP